jgi:hypothetical protein
MFWHIIIFLPSLTVLDMQKKKKKPSAVAAPTSTVDVTGPSSDPPTSTPAPSNTIVPVTLDPAQISQQKKDKKARQRAKKAADGDDGQDEVDRAIAELSLKFVDMLLFPLFFLIPMLHKRAAS